MAEKGKNDFLSYHIFLTGWDESQVMMKLLWVWVNVPCFSSMVTYGIGTDEWMMDETERQRTVNIKTPDCLFPFPSHI